MAQADEPDMADVLARLDALTERVADLEQRLVTLGTSVESSAANTLRVQHEIDSLADLVRKLGEVLPERE